MEGDIGRALVDFLGEEVEDESEDCRAFRMSFGELSESEDFAFDREFF